MAGTSQAAVASGVAVQLLHDGVQPEDARAHLQLGAHIVPQSLAVGEGAGQMRSDGTLAAQPHAPAPQTAHIGMLRYLWADGSDVASTVDMTAMDETGLPPADVNILVTALVSVKEPQTTRSLGDSGSPGFLASIWPLSVR